MISPRPNPAARGAFINLTLQHTLAHVYRAILESIACSLRENLELMAGAGLQIDLVRAIGGGAGSPLWLQIKADVTGQEIEKPVVTEAAVLGAVVLAATSTGNFSSMLEAGEALYRAERLFSPRRAEQQRYEQCYEAYLRYQKTLFP
ncbi:MAG: FGGY-family carbohydrate kinase [Acidobacteriota bacterium]